ncbi:MAG: HNH endonuclease [Candidatus Limnocylindrales bacterium]
MLRGSATPPAGPINCLRAPSATFDDSTGALADRGTATGARATSATLHEPLTLTVDHVVPLTAGGAPFDVANTAVLCRSCNSTKGASTEERLRLAYGVGRALRAEPSIPSS